MSPAPDSDFDADEPMQDDGAAQVIARAMRSVRFVEALRRLEAEGISLGLGPGVLTLMQRYADGALRMPELVAQARARMRTQAQMQMQAPGTTRRKTE